MSLIVAIPDVNAQSSVTSEDEFWTLLTQTYDELSSTQSANLASLRAVWGQMEEVRLDDGTVIRLELAWLIDGLAVANTPTRNELRTRIKALMDYHTAQTRIPDFNNPLDSLGQVLKDDRFQYPDVTPTPIIQEQSNFDMPDIPMPGAGFSQIVLVGTGIFLIGLVCVYVMRRLKGQGASVCIDDEFQDVPDTANQARELAQTSEQIQDYRNAVRYLYLSSLLMLDEQGVIHFDRTLTNREHLQQVVNRPEMLDTLRPVVNVFDNVWYGFAPLDDLRYQEFRRNVDRLWELAE